VSDKRAHHKLVVWQKSLDLAQTVYLVTKKFPKEEIYALTNQMRRAAVSVPSNIAEGAARASNKEFLHYLSISRGSLSELETQIMVAKRVGYISDIEIILNEIESIFSLLGGLMKSIKEKST